jgi:hypothetical protein
VPDPRDPRGVRHPLTSLLLAAVAAVLAGARSFAAIGEWATVAAGLAFPHAAQAIAITRRVRPLSEGKWRTVTAYEITSLIVTQASPGDLAGWIRGHWRIEAMQHIRDVTYARTPPRSAPEAAPKSWPHCATWPPQSTS